VYTLRFKEESYADDDDNELYKVFRQWQDPGYLFDFFRANKADLAYFDNRMLATQAMERTVDQSYVLFERLFGALGEAEKGNFSVLESLFTNVGNTPRHADFVEQKFKRFWLRLFAVRTDDDLYFITGGAIKLTRALQDRRHTQRELDKARDVANYLRAAVDEDRFYEVYELTI
jgi:hypothetical protein